MPGISFDRAAGFYDETRGFPEGVPENICKALVDYTAANITTRFLELGIGTGRIALPFIKSGYDFTGVDISSEMLKRLENKLAEELELPKYRYNLQVGDVTALPFPENSFDIAIAVHVVHLVSDLAQTLKEAKRVLRKPGGCLVIAHEQAVEEAGELSPEQTVRQKWGRILAGLGSDLRKKRERAWHSEEISISYLQELGAEIEKTNLLEFELKPLSQREMANRLINRMYSSDWEHSDEIHTQAVVQLNNWLASEVENPDKPYSGKVSFRAIIARW
ncbi:MAG: class I SAM-dependent methyltransferase [Chloroflexi bacterium]|uniref:Class I SAM-dependent methyltransferase n=1 Tax=Candidatus Chlorohelix allophototropha TaxID=3003348 RepID=A0A8T7LWD6_9CHLR|nr:class I SAM-dependent methyltransferase [Chloroflexota bacterium]WJW67149.1 class I SAM-dependent methyltransferase [Chloroflexota bacterium L227-S17]